MPDKPRHYETKAKNAQEAHEAIRPTDFGRDRAGSGDHARLYELIWKRALASQMASARLERTTAELADGTGRHALRATGQVVLFPGFLALYEEGPRRRGRTRKSRRLPRLREGDTPAKKEVEAEQHFTQPPPRYSEASLVKRMEELGIGRPSTYAATLQTLKDRDYVRLEKNRFIPEESGRLLTAFLERFFERYVSYDFTAHLEDELDDISGGRARLAGGARGILARLQAEDRRGDGAEAVARSPPRSTISSRPGCSRTRATAPIRGSARPAARAGWALRGGRFGAFVACSNYPDCKFTRRFGQGGERGEDRGPQMLGQDPETGQDVTLRSGRFGPYFQLGEGKEAKRASMPKDVPARTPTSTVALRLLSLPRAVGDHPETGKPITASIGRYGPYLAHDGKYAKLASTAEVFEIGMNAAVAKLADAASGGGRASRRRASRSRCSARIRAPRLEIRLMEGRFGPYVTDGTTNATLPKSLAPDAADAGGGGAADRRARRQGAAGEEGQGPQGARRRPSEEEDTKK